MTADEFKAWRTEHNMPLKEAAEALGTTLRAVQYWEAGDRPISRTVALACAAVQAGLAPFGEPE